MKIRPHRSLGILLAGVILALVMLIIFESGETMGDAPTGWVPMETGADWPDPASPSSWAVDQNDYAASMAERHEQQAAAEEAMAGVLALMLLNEAARQQNQIGTSGGYSGSGQAYDYAGRWGSGSQYADGSWNHYSGAAGGAVGGTSDGCVYTTFGWSNC